MRPPDCSQRGDQQRDLKQLACQRAQPHADKLVRHVAPNPTHFRIIAAKECNNLPRRGAERQNGVDHEADEHRRTKGNEQIQLGHLTHPTRSLCTPYSCSPSNSADPIRTTVGDITSTLKAWPIDANTYIILVTRGHKHDEAALGAVLDSPARYIGMIGSRRKVKVIRDDLLRAGADESRLSRVHAPIGLDIHAVTTEEIALSMAAQLVSIRRADHHSAVEGPIPVKKGAR